MTRGPRMIAAAAVAALAVPATASAHVSFHPNALPAKSEVTVDLRVPNEIDNGNITSVALKLPNGIIEALGDPPAGWSFKAKTRRLANPVKTDDGLVTSEVTEVAFTGGDTPPGEFVNLPLTLAMPDSAKQGSVLSFPTVQTYSNGRVVRWIGSPSDDNPAPTVDVTAPGTALLDVTGGDAGPPATLPADLTGARSAPTNAAPAVTQTVVKKETSTLGIAALIVGVIALLVALGLLARRPATAARAQSAAPPPVG